jgi:hypothetical protein
MKIETITEIIELTIEEKHAVTVCRKRKIVSRASDRAEAKRISEIEERNAEIPTNRSEPDGSRKHNQENYEDEYREKYERSNA